MNVEKEQFKAALMVQHEAKLPTKSTLSQSINGNSEFSQLEQKISDLTKTSTVHPNNKRTIFSTQKSNCHEDLFGFHDFSTRKPPPAPG
jgi:hypothetical protein